MATNCDSLTDVQSKVIEAWLHSPRPTSGVGGLIELSSQARVKPRNAFDCRRGD